MIDATPNRARNSVGRLRRMPRLRRHLGLALAFAMLPAIAGPVAAGPSGAYSTPHPFVHPDSAIYRGVQEGRRIVAIADIHGAWDSFTSILKEVGLVDADLSWAAGDTIFVQTGDIADRGPEVRACLDLLMRLQQEAPEQGGEVIVVFGNHEAMNIIDFHRDGSPDDFAAFVDEGSERRQQEAYEAWVEMRKQRAKDLDEPRARFTSEVERNWKGEHPLGYFERMDAFGPDGHYGIWLRQLPTAVRLGNLLFMHAGLNPEFADMTPDEMSEMVWGELRRFDKVKRLMVQEGLITRYADLVEIITAADVKLVSMTTKYRSGNRRPPPEERELARELAWILEYQKWQMLTRDGLLWFRGLAQWPEDEHAEEVTEILEKQDVEHIILGHTVQLEGNIRTRFDGRVFLNDTGMLTSVYHGRPSALQIEAGRFTAVYVDERQILWPRPAAPVDVLTFEATGPSRRQPTPRVRQISSSGRRRPRTAPQASGTDGNPSGGRIWWARDGTQLPFRHEEELLEFLRSAPIVDSVKLETGITEASRLELERDGIRLRAIFHTIDLRRERARINGRFHMVFVDSWRSQVAAYYLARLLGVDNVPPTVQRKVGEEYGSLQLWLENDGLMSNSERIAQRMRPTDLDSWLAQQWVMEVFDALIFNDDRNTGNVLVDGEWTLWMIDHTRAFQREPTIRDPNKLTHIERGIWEALNDLPDETYRSALEPFVGHDQINGFLTRRDLVIEHFQALIDRNGEDEVLYESIPRSHSTAFVSRAWETVRAQGAATKLPRAWETVRSQGARREGDRRRTLSTS